MSEASLQYVLDRFEIQDTIARYTEGQDTHQGDDGNIREQWDNVFDDDAVIDYTTGGGGAGPAELTDYRTLAQWMRGDGTTPGRMSAFTNWQHMLGLPVVTVDGDTATGWTEYFATHKGKAGTPLEGKSVYAAGAYHDKLARTAKGWRVVHRRLEVFFIDTVQSNFEFV